MKQRQAPSDVIANNNRRKYGYTEHLVTLLDAIIEVPHSLNELELQPQRDEA